MLTKEDNETLTRVGPGTLMGNLLRRYWLPALLSTEVPAPDSPPVRVRLLGEDLVAFRDTNGSVGLFVQSCPHRGASLFFGRNEECGLRCVYHGWKYDVTGQCVDMPSEPAESNFKSKVRVGAYPTHESGGIIWTYMGPPDARRPPQRARQRLHHAALHLRAPALPTGRRRLLHHDGADRRRHVLALEHRHEAGRARGAAAALRPRHADDRPAHRRHAHVHSARPPAPHSVRPERLPHRPRGATHAQLH